MILVDGRWLRSSFQKELAPPTIIKRHPGPMCHLPFLFAPGVEPSTLKLVQLGDLIESKM